MESQLIEKYASDLFKIFPIECMYLEVLTISRKSIDKEDKNTTPKAQLKSRKLIALMKSCDVEFTFPGNE